MFPFSNRCGNVSASPLVFTVHESCFTYKSLCILIYTTPPNIKECLVTWLFSTMERGHLLTSCLWLDSSSSTGISYPSVHSAFSSCETVPYQLICLVSHLIGSWFCPSLSQTGAVQDIAGYQVPTLVTFKILIFPPKHIPELNNAFLPGVQL